MRRSTSSRAPRPLLAAAFAWAATTPLAHAQRVATGPSSSATPYVRPFAGYPADVYSVLTVGDSVNARPDGTPYRLVGIPDGMGSYLNPDGTTTLLVTHELAASAGGGMRRAHQHRLPRRSQHAVRPAQLRQPRRQQAPLTAPWPGLQHLRQCRPRPTAPRQQRIERRMPRLQSRHVRTRQFMGAPDIGQGMGRKGHGSSRERPPAGLAEMVEPQRLYKYTVIEASDELA